MRPRATVPLERCRIGTPDGDFLNLDYAPEPSPGSRLVVLLHGLEGSTRRGYMSEMLRQLFVRGLRGVGMNFRGCGGEPNRVARFYHSAETGDLAHVVSGLRHGFSGADDYYVRADVRPRLAGIRFPTLLVQSRDDPFVPGGAIPEAAVAANPHITPAFTDRGGHLGFVEGTFPWRRRFRAERLAARFLAERLL